MGGGVSNNTGADQPAHLHSLISVFVIHILESIICKLATFFKLVSVAEETGLNLTLSETSKTSFLGRGPYDRAFFMLNSTVHEFSTAYEN